jgi:hypothetical protein
MFVKHIGGSNSCTQQEFRMTLKKMTLKMKLQAPTQDQPIAATARTSDDELHQFAEGDVIDEVTDVKDVIDEGTFRSRLCSDRSV